jgi:hypothetical protein
MLDGRLFDPGLGPLCPPCPFLEICGAERSEDACRNEWGTPETGGEHVLHPLRSDSLAYFETVGGPEFDGVFARPIQGPRLPTYLPQLRVRRGLRGWLPDDVYAIRAKEVIGTRKHPLAASSLRSELGLADWQQLVLLLFDDDRYLERLWNEAGSLLPELAEAQYDWVVAPSFSCWRPRSRFEQMFNLKRSLRIFEALQKLEVPAIPRIGWGVEADVERSATWLNANRCVETVALDLSTYRASEDWQSQVDGLRLLDRRTHRHLHYLVNGTSVVSRCAELYSIVPARRLCITNSTLAPPPEPSVSGQLQLVDSKDKEGRKFAASCARNRRVLKEAAVDATRRRRQDVKASTSADLGVPRPGQGLRRVQPPRGSVRRGATKVLGTPQESDERGS